MTDASSAAAAPAGPAAAAQSASVAEAKSIILFSDGTGNSSGKLFKTNVWRMYEAVDLGPPEPGQRKQIAFYDDGVGTSGFKPLAILGGVFGVGLKRNVLDIYRYACRNYQPAPNQMPGDDGSDGGDHVYGFGFSRGAFTMRTAIAMIAKVGLVITQDEAELDRRTREAWRAYRAGYAPRRSWAPLNLFRNLFYLGRDEEQMHRDAVEQERARNYHPVIRFVGVWDTVAAYGGPVTEITEAIDNWIVRLSMPNYKLADGVRRARHALSIDDERDAFHPLLWDELHEEERIAARKTHKKPWIDERRLEQVWFTGMHADVGGGYPDESLSYISFLWMMEEAEEAGLRPVPVMLERFHALASSAGPIHNSRAGVGSYYRYQPRRIAVWMEPVAPQLRVRRHPDLERGLIRSAKVHESVVSRIATGTDRYAPIALPANVKVVPPQRMGENAPSPGEDRCRGGLKGPRLPLISEELRERFEHPAWNAARARAMDAVWSLAGQRRVTYIVSLALTLALALMPLWVERFPPAPVLASGHGLTGQLIAVLAVFLPAFLVAVVESWANNPFYLLFLLAALVVSNGIASGFERRLRDTTRRIWNEMIDLDVSDAPATPGEPANGRGSWVKRFVRWRLAPFLIFVAILLVAAWLLLAVTTRVVLAFQERGETLCPASSPPPVERRAATFRFDTRGTCHPAGLHVTKGDRYFVEVNMTGAWWDGSHPADPRGLRAADIGFFGYVAVPLRRAVGANYLQPVARIRGGFAGPALQPLALTQRGPSLRAWRGEFVAARTGELSLFANEAMLPFAIGRVPTTHFYTHERYGNRGTAIVTVTHIDAVADR